MACLRSKFFYPAVCLIFACCSASCNTRHLETIVTVMSHAVQLTDARCGSIFIWIRSPDEVIAKMRHLDVADDAWCDLCNYPF